MKLKSDQYWRSLKSVEKQDLADRIKVTKVYLSNVMNGHVRPSIDLSRKIEAETNSEVSKKVLRPDINWKIIDAG